MDIPIASLLDRSIPESRLRPGDLGLAPTAASVLPFASLAREAGRTRSSLPGESLFGSLPWIEALAGTYGFTIEVSTNASGDSPDEEILFSEIDDVRGRRIVSLPFSDYLDPLVEDAAAWRRLVAPILARGAPVRFRCLRNAVPLGDPRFSRTDAALWHGADLTRPQEQMWAELKGSGRQNIRNAERHGIKVREGRTLEDLRLFHGLHCHVRKHKYQLLAQPFALFEHLHAAFSGTDGLAVLLAELEGTPIAGILFLIHNHTLYYKFNASIDLVHRPNDLLVWNGLLLGRRLGLKQLDFGLSDLGQPGLVRFKRKFATEERTISELRWAPEGHADPRGQQAGALLHDVTRLLTAPSVPDEVTRAGGDALYRFFC